MESGAAEPAAPRSSVYSGAATTAAIAVGFVAVFVLFAVWSGGWYQTWKALHVLAAIVWVGGALMIQLFSFRILREGDGARMAQFAKDVELIGMRTFIPATLVLAILGFVLVHQGAWPYTFWVVFGIVIWVLSFVTGLPFLGPESGRIGKLIDERGPEDAEVQRRIERVLLFSRVEMTLIALAAMDMVLKPGS